MADDRDSQDTSALLQSALSSAFSVVDAPRVSPNLNLEGPSSTSSSASEEPSTESSTASSSSTDDEKWKKEYDSYVERWKAESAIEREKAERTRAEWEAKRQAEGLNMDEFPPLAGPPNPHFPRTAGFPASPSPADVRDSVSGEPSGQTRISQVSSFASVAAVGEGHSSPASHGLEQSSHWEEVSSLHSSLSFPTPSQSASLELPPKADMPSERKRAVEQPKKLDPPKSTHTQSVSLSIFDDRLSKRSRSMALLTSFAINLALPFINGVMLGFGEIFARTLLAKWGWNVPGGAATAVGIGANSRGKR